MERLRKVMAERGITQYQLAKAIGAKTNTVNNWFTGRASCPRDHYLHKIALFLRVPPAWLRYGDNNYAPTIDSEASMLAEEIAGYGPDAVQKARQMLNIFFKGEKGVRKDSAIYTEKKAKRKTA